MKLILYTLVLTALLLSGCEERCKIRKQIKGTKTLTYQINTTGTFNQTAYIRASTLINGLLGTNYNDVQIDEFVIQGLNFNMITNSTNKASSVDVESAYIQGFRSGTLMPERNFSLGSLTNFEVSAFLLADGVSEVNSEITKLLKGLNTDDLRLSVMGSAVPKGQLASLTLVATITYTVKFSHCMESLGMLRFGCDPC